MSAASPIAFTHFPTLRNAQGKRYHSTWSKLVERLCVSREYADKHDAPGLSLATFRGDQRSLANVEHVYAVGLDFDERLDWGMLCYLFDNSDSFIHTTWSSTEEEPRARAFVRLSRPVTADEYRRVYAAVCDRVSSAALVVDLKASDPSRFWFLPSTPPGAPYRYSIGRGKPVHVDSALAAFPAAPPPAPYAPVPRVGPVGDVEARAAAYLDKCEPAISGQGGHTTTFLVARALVQKFALDVDTAFRVMLAWNARCQPPWSERELRRKLQQAADHGRAVHGELRDRPLRRAS